MGYTVVSARSKLLKKVQNWGDSTSSTVGFLSREAFVDYAQKGRILALTEDDELLACIVYRYRKNTMIVKEKAEYGKYGNPR